MTYTTRKPGNCEHGWPNDDPTTCAECKLIQSISPNDVNTYRDNPLLALDEWGAKFTKDIGEALSEATQDRGMEIFEMAHAAFRPVNEFKMALKDARVRVAVLQRFLSAAREHRDEENERATKAYQAIYDFLYKHLPGNATPAEWESPVEIYHKSWNQRLQWLKDIVGPPLEEPDDT